MYVKRKLQQTNNKPHFLVFYLIAHTANVLQF